MSRVAASVGKSIYRNPEVQRSPGVYGLGLHLGSGLDLLAEPATRDTSQGQDNYKTTTRQLQDNYKTTARQLHDNYKTTTRQLQDNYKTTTRQQMMLPEATLLVLGA